MTQMNADNDGSFFQQYSGRPRLCLTCHQKASFRFAEELYWCAFHNRFRLRLSAAEALLLPVANRETFNLSGTIRFHRYSGARSRVCCD